MRALTRVATPETEERLLAVGQAGTAEHVERIVRAWRYVDRKAEAGESAQRHTSRVLHVYQDADGMVTIRGRLEPEAGALLLRALEAARERLYRQTWSTPRTRTEEPGPTAWPDTAAALPDEDAESATGTTAPPFEAETDPLLRPMLPPPVELPTLGQQQADALVLLAEIIKQKVDQRKVANAREGDKRDYELHLLVTRFNKGNAFARAMLAGLGQIHLDGTVTLLQLPDRTEAGKFSLKKTFAWGGIYGASTSMEDIERTFADGVAAAVTGQAETPPPAK